MGDVRIQQDTDGILSITLGDGKWLVDLNKTIDKRVRAIIATESPLESKRRLERAGIRPPKPQENELGLSAFEDVEAAMAGAGGPISEPRKAQTGDAALDRIEQDIAEPVLPARALAELHRMLTAWADSSTLDQHSDRVRLLRAAINALDALTIERHVRDRATASAAQAKDTGEAPVRGRDAPRAPGELWRIYLAQPCPYDDCPPGLFVYNGNVCLKPGNGGKPVQTSTGEAVEITKPVTPAIASPARLNQIPPAQPGNARNPAPAKTSAPSPTLADVQVGPDGGAQGNRWSRSSQ